MIQSRAPSFSLPRRYPCEDDVGAGSHINSCLPRGHDRLLDAELIARNMAGYVNNGIATLRVTEANCGCPRSNMVRTRATSGRQCDSCELGTRLSSGFSLRLVGVPVRLL